MCARIRSEYKKKKWVVLPQNSQLRDLFYKNLGISAVTAQIIANRGIKDVESARRFLQPRLELLLEPEKLMNMNLTVERIECALRKNENITIYGDYDVDGITGASLLMNYLKLLGRTCNIYIPDRIKEGYSLNKSAIDTIKKNNTKLLITIDCGTADVEEIAYAKERGIDTIVIDHHKPGNVLPPAYAIVNPKLDSSYTTEISAVAVVFKLCWALSQNFSNSRKVSDEFKSFLIEGVGLVSLGTVADVVPLLEENRIFVAYGLKVIKKSPNCGVKALIKKCGLEGKNIDTSDIAFIIAPRMNAGGRLESASVCVELLTTKDEHRAFEIIDELDKLNKKRQAIEDDILKDAIELTIEQNDVEHDKVIVVANDGWHIGVIGIVASRLVENFQRPVVVISIEGEKGRGSARSNGTVDIHRALDFCRGLLIGGGGHSMAGGLEIETKNINLFRGKINEFAENYSETITFDTVNKLIIDTEISLNTLTTEFVKELEMLAPFGVGNPRPVFLSSNVKFIGQPTLIGRKGEHFSVSVLQGSNSLRAVGFRMANLLKELPLFSDTTFSIAYTPKINTFWGTENVELELKDVKISNE